jgi:putative addiction module CopG family antidote
MMLRQYTDYIELLNISLTPELERFVQNKVESGMYTSASEVIRESLRLLHTHDDLIPHIFFEYRS